MDNNYGICLFDYSDYNFADENGICWNLDPRDSFNLQRVYESIDVESTSPNSQLRGPCLHLVKDKLLLGYTTKFEWAQSDGKQRKHKRRYFWIPADLKDGCELEDGHAVLRCSIRAGYPSLVASCALAGWPDKIPAELECLTLLEVTTI